jgi:hypothetical protein
MNIIELTIHQKITQLKSWQFDFREKIRIDPFWEGYNASVISEINFLENLLKEITK